ncbi:ABC transporter permease [Thermus thermamylovorans]|uniref:ABC transporter permease n=1 Tax=Thermus thermamylovorans TaxID=2509362 RepID=A0A4Q9B5V9_9DEIN|nr:ABC transporter permease [Thermus thermamylovorans]TBH21016.1 ABC transporter permease [Thermus thermamylovorans]
MTRGILPALWQTPPGRAGLLLLAPLVLGALLAWLAYPRDFGPRLWHNPAAWADFPKAVPPAWTAPFTGRVPHRVLEAREPSREVFDPVFRLGFSLRGPSPVYLVLALGEVVYWEAPPLVEVVLVRPDGEVLLHREVLPGPLPGETPPFRRHFQEPWRRFLGEGLEVAEALESFFRARYGFGHLPLDLPGALFARPGPGGILLPLEGEYQVVVRLRGAHPEDWVGWVRLVLGGEAYGLMGTDTLGRDLIHGLLYGLPLALAIGLSVALWSTALGAFLGLWSGYAGGATDTLIQRLADVLNNLPLLPLLIFLVFVLGANLWITLLVLVAFSWPGLAILVRSAVLQLRAGLEVEAARALGAGPFHILRRHVLPHLVPYLLLQGVFAVPGAILAEAGLSFLGLGDPSLPTWGQMLEAGFRTGAVFLGYWWWVVPPGLLLALTALAFMLLAMGLEALVDPRLRRGG